MNMKINKILSLVFMVIFCVSCKKETVYEALTGDVKGRVRLIDINGSTTEVNDLAGVEVTVEGSSPAMKAITDDKGLYSFTNLETGIYDIVFKKDGFSTYKIVSWPFTGGTVTTYIDNIYLYKLPDSEIIRLHITTPYNANGETITFSSIVTNEAATLYQYYISDKANVSYSDYLITGHTYSYQDEMIINISRETIFILPKNKKLYIIAYPSGYNSNSYLDIETGLQIYPVNPAQASNVVEFTIPE